MNVRRNTFENDIDFVASHYDGEAFDRRKAWLSVAGAPRRLRLGKWVAAASLFIVFAASAFIFTGLHNRPTDSAPAPESVTFPPAPQKKERSSSARLEFADAPLSEVVGKIEETYGVSVEGLPEVEYSLTLSYEGGAQDLIETINDILQTDLRIKGQ